MLGQSRHRRGQQLAILLPLAKNVPAASKLGEGIYWISGRIQVVTGPTYQGVRSLFAARYKILVDETTLSSIFIYISYCVRFSFLFLELFRTLRLWNFAPLGFRRPPNYISLSRRRRLLILLVFSFAYAKPPFQ